MSQMPPPPDSGYITPPSGPRPAELLDRFLARLIDGVLLVVVNGIIVTAIIIGGIMGSSASVIGTGGSYAAVLVSSLVSAAIYVGYFAFMEATQGRTVGKMVMKLRTVGPDGGNPTVEQAVRRNIWMGFGVLGIIPIIGGIIGALGELVAVIMIAVGINNDTVNRQAWHDKFAGGTRVIKQG